MTREEEIEKLIRQQKRDDTYRVSGRVGDVRLDSTWAEGFSWADAIGVDEDGTLISFVSFPPFVTFEHGEGGYANHKCRCPICTAANTEGQRKRRARPKRHHDPETYKHGVESGYVYYGCRCQECRGAANRARQQRRQR